jgi:hypothetical protein
MKIRIMGANSNNWYCAAIGKIFTVIAENKDSYSIRGYLSIAKEHCIIVEKESIFYMIKKDSISKVNNPQKVYWDIEKAKEDIENLCRKYPESKFYLLQSISCSFVPQQKITTIDLVKK